MSLFQKKISWSLYISSLSKSWSPLKNSWVSDLKLVACVIEDEHSPQFMVHEILTTIRDVHITMHFRLPDIRNSQQTPYSCTLSVEAFLPFLKHMQTLMFRHLPDRELTDTVSSQYVPSFRPLDSSISCI